MQQIKKGIITMRFTLNENDFTTQVHTLEVTSCGIANGSVTGMKASTTPSRHTGELETTCRLNPNAYAGRIITNRYDLIATVNEMLEAVQLDSRNYIVNRIDFSFDVHGDGSYEKYLKFFRAFIILVKYSRNCRNIMQAFDPTTFENLTVKTSCSRGSFDIEYYNKKREAWNKFRQTDIDGRFEIRAKNLKLHCAEFKSIHGAFADLLDIMDNATESVDVMSDKLVTGLGNKYLEAVRSHSCHDIGGFCRFMQEFIYSRKMLQELYMFSRENADAKQLSESMMQKRAMKFSSNFCDRVKGFQTISKNEYVNLVAMIFELIYTYDDPEKIPLG